MSRAMIEPPSFPDVSVMVVDEAPYARRLLREILSRVGIRRIIEAPDGAEALAQLAENLPDVVILNWQLPILSGEEFVRLARTPATSPLPTVPIIVTLSRPEKIAVDRAVRLGVNEILVKPFSPKALWSRMDEVLNRPRPYVRSATGLMCPVPRERRGQAA